MKKKSFYFNSLWLACMFVAVLGMTGCDSLSNQLKTDREAGLETQDFRDAFKARPSELDEDPDELTRKRQNIPSLQPYISAGDGHIETMPLVSVFSNQTVPLRDILFQLANQIGYDLELDPRIRGSIIFTARERPFDQVIRRISEIAGLRYKFEEDTLRVELDTPYNKVYKIDYLSYIRSNSSAINNSVSISAEGTDSGSTFSSSAESQADFWGELETNLEQILAGINISVLRTMADPRISAVDREPQMDVQSLAPVQDGDNITVSPPESTLRVEPLPVGDDAMEELEEFEATYAVNRQAGLLNVYATQRQHREVQEYLHELRRSATSQVLIEAKILEVTLADEFITGIDWRALDITEGDRFALNYLSSGFGILDTLGPSTAPLQANAQLARDSNFVVGWAGDDVQGVIEAISGFGTVRALASPRLTVLNNQSAVLNVVDNRVFFEIEIDVTSEEGVTTTEVESEIRSVPEGVLINVQPSIDLDNQTVSMAVRPSITRVTGTVPDPAVQFLGIAGVQSLIPELNVQEVDSVIQVRSGQPVVMGGLLQDRTQTNEEGIPILSDVPIMGRLFEQHNDITRKTELVIFLQATILESPSASIHNTDRDMYRKFSSDRRPFRL